MGPRIAAILALSLATLVATAPAVRAAATITIVNLDGPNEGFNDPTPVVPVGGNSGTTLGQQRLIVFQHAAQKWAATLDSVVPVVVNAYFDPLTCTATGAVLGSAGALFVMRDFPAVAPHPGPLYSGTWHSSALADKRAGGELLPGQADIQTRFNSSIGTVPGCLTGRAFYMGLDGNHGTNIDLAAVVLHELGHGLGFQQFASLTTGALFLGLPDVYNTQIFDNSRLKTWVQMDNSERLASAVNPRRVTFRGPTVTSAVPLVLQAGTPLLRVLSPASIAGVFDVGAASFGPPLASPGLTGDIVVGLDPADAIGPSTTDGCSPFTNAAAVNGRIALVDRGTCGFAVKVKNAQNAGAIGVVIADNVAGGPPAGLGGTDPTIVIPSVRITLADGNLIKARLTAGDIVSGTLGVDLSVAAGADPAGYALLNSPNPVQTGSSISHWDPIATPNQIMEPSINPGLPFELAPPVDLTLPLMRDIGWFADPDLDGVENDACPVSNRQATVVIGGIDTGVPNPLFTSGCTITDLVLGQATGAGNHGQFVSGVANLLNALRNASIITGAQRGAIQNAAARAALP